MGKVMERRYICKNGIVEKTRFAVGENTAVHPRWRKAKSSQDKREENQRQAIRELARVFNCNASQEDWFVKLDFAPAAYEKIFAGMNPDEILVEAQRQGSLFLRRLKRRVACKEQLKAVTTASDMDAETGELVRVHLHLWISGAEEQQVRDAWKMGSCTHMEHLYRQDDYTPLAAYMLEQVRPVPNMKKYIPTRNLEKPVVEDRVVSGDPADEVRVQPGAKVLSRTPYREGMVAQYVRYKRREPKKKRGGKKETGTEGQTETGKIGSCGRSGQHEDKRS